MAKDSNPKPVSTLDSTDGLIKTAAIAAIGSNPAQQNPDVMGRLFELLTRRLEDEEEQKAREIAERKKFAEHSVQQARIAMAKRKRDQARCNHIKHNGQSRLSGQFLSNGVLLLLCQNCNKEWRDGFDEEGKPLIDTLYPPDEMIGGSR